MLDRRFLSISLVIQAIANSPAANPVVGTQYIVGTNPAGAFAGATANSIARFNGTVWKFTAPRAGSLEVFNADTYEILSYDGSKWTTVAYLRSDEAEYIDPVNAIVASGTSLPASAAKGDLFLNTADAKLYTATAADTWNAGVLTLNGDRYASSTDFNIYWSNGSEVSAVRIINGNMFFNKADNCIYIYDQSANAYVRVGGGIASETVTDIHSLTAEEVTAKSFTLKNSVKNGYEAHVLLFVSGVAQTVNVDFIASGNTISWNNKGLDTIGLIEGDTFIVHYIKE